MIREIKFRCWIPSAKKMVEDSLMIGNFGDGEGSLVVDSEVQIGEALNGLIWLQYTGIKDKNGIEIYDGDIVERRRLYNKNHISKGKVIFRDGKFEVDYGNLIFEDFKENNTSEMMLKVIGNIYLNKENLTN